MSWFKSQVYKTAQLALKARIIGHKITIFLTKFSTISVSQCASHWLIKLVQWFQYFPAPTSTECHHLSFVGWVVSLRLCRAAADTVQTPGSLSDMMGNSLPFFAPKEKRILAYHRRQTKNILYMISSSSTVGALCSSLSCVWWCCQTGRRSVLASLRPANCLRCRFYIVSFGCITEPHNEQKMHCHMPKLQLNYAEIFIMLLYHLTSDWSALFIVSFPCSLSGKIHLQAWITSFASQTSRWNITKWLCQQINLRELCDDWHCTISRLPGRLISMRFHITKKLKMNAEMYPRTEAYAALSLRMYTYRLVKRLHNGRPCANILYHCVWPICPDRWQECIRN